MNAMIAWVTARPRGVVVVFAVLTAALGFFATRLRIDSSIDNMLPSDSPDIRFYERVREIFGSDEIGVIGLRSDDLFSERTLRKIQRITSAVEAIDGVDKVISLTNAVDPSRDAFTPPPIILQVPPTAEQRADVEKLFAETPLFAINLVSPDLRGTAINVFFENLSDARYADLGIDSQIGAILAAESGPEALFYTSSAHVKLEATTSMRRDLYVFTPVALGLVLATFWLSFRRLRAVVTPIVAVAVAIVWVLGVMVLSGRSINLGTFLLPPLLLVIGSSYAIHFLSHYYDCLASSREPSPGGQESTIHLEALRNALARVWAPMAISACTTVVGFGALAINRVPAIRELGLFAVIGISFLAINCLTLMPAILSLWSESPRARRAPVPQGSALRSALSRSGGIAYDHRWSVIAGFLLIAIVSLGGLKQIRVDSDFLGYFDPGSKVRTDNEAINREIVGSNPFYLVVESDTPGALERWDVLRRIRELQQHLLTIPGVSGSISIVDYLELIERGYRGGDEDFTIGDDGELIPFEKPKPFWEDPASLVPLLNLIRKNAASFTNVITPDFSTANILVRTSLSGARATEEALAEIRRYVGESFPGNLRITPTGTLVLMTGNTSEVIGDQIRSLSIALVFIFVAMALLFLSIRVGLLAILPNALAIFLYYGLLGWLGIYLNLGTSPIATIALSMAVDSTIHFMTAFSRNARKDPDQRAALVRTMSDVGVPVCYTTAALLLGFLTFAGSSFVPIREFGQLTAATLAAAWFANVILLPALLATTRIITLWDLVGLRLGDDPSSNIPLFAGLRPSQARVVVLMGKLQHYSDGEAIMRQGDAGHTMHVIVEGNADVFAADGTQRKKISELHRGDLFGEMAMIRREQRTADVIAVGAVETLMIDERFFDRLRRRYPRIAARVLVNMTRILSDRLQRMTTRFVGRE